MPFCALRPVHASTPYLFISVRAAALWMVSSSTSESSAPFSAVRTTCSPVPLGSVRGVPKTWVKRSVNVQNTTVAIVTG